MGRFLLFGVTVVVPIWGFWIALVAMIVGLFGVFVPIFPDAIFIWLVILVYAIAEQFTAIDPVAFIVLTVLSALGFGAEFWMSQAGAKAGGASIWSLLVGLALGAIGAAIGLIFLGIGAIPGAILGALVGLVLAEWYQRRDWRRAFKAGGGLLAGYLLSVGVQLFIDVVIILIFAWQALKG